MPIQSVKNLYPGINAHLMSILQSEQDQWGSFHAQHIINIRDAIEPELPRFYIAQAERSLQIRDGRRLGRPVTDTTLSQMRRAAERVGSATLRSAKPTARVPVAETIALSEDDYYHAIIIYDLRGGGRKGTPVTRIELLSPSNKSPNTDFRQYLEKRDATLKSGVRLVELDYLHETRSPISILPGYPTGDTKAYPYAILVSDPRPTLEEGETAIYGFSVGDEIPVVDVPLADKDILAFDFGAVYQSSYSMKRVHYELVDYEQLPPRFNTYSFADQERIKSLIQMVKEAKPQS